MKRYIVSPEAQQDLRDIRKHLLDEAGIAVTPQTQVQSSGHMKSAIANRVMFLLA